MKSLHRQRGMSLWGVVFLTALVLFTGLLLVKMSGVYYDHQTLNKTIRNALAGQTATGFSESEFFDRVAKNMQINGIRIDLKKNSPTTNAKVRLLWCSTMKNANICF